MSTPTTVIDTFPINGRDYEIFRITDVLYGIRPLPTKAEIELPDPRRPYLPHAYASSVKPAHLHLGHPEAPISDGWQIRDEMNRIVFGYAATFPEMAQVAANGLNLPA